MGLGVTLEPYKQLELAIEQKFRARNVVACSSGSAALHLALEALELPLGSQVLIPEFTMVACARAVSLAGLKPVPIDCDDSLLLDVEKAADYITPQTRAIMPVSIYGRQYDRDKIVWLARLYDLCIIEDLAEAHGTSINPMAKASCWSFYKNKIVAGEEGGAVAFSARSLANAAHQLKNCGFNQQHNFHHKPRSMNYRMSNAHASLILDSLNNLEENLVFRKQVENWYNYYVPKAWQMPERSVPWVYDLKLPHGTNPQAVVDRLNSLHVAARRAFAPISFQPEYLGHYQHLNAAWAYRTVIYLPIQPKMEQADVKSIVCKLRECLSPAPA